MKVISIFIFLIICIYIYGFFEIEYMKVCYRWILLAIWVLSVAGYFVFYAFTN